MQIYKKHKPKFLFSWLFLLLFAPVFKIGGFRINSSYLLIFIPAIIGFLNFYFRIEKNLILRYLLKIFILSGIFLFFRQFISFFRDISIIRDLIIGYILFFACYCCVKTYHSLYKDRFFETILKHVYYAGLIHSIIVVITFVFPAIKPILYNFIWVTPKAAKYLIGEASGYRFQGIVQSGFSTLSTIHALYFIFGSVYFKIDINNRNSLKIIKYTFYQIIIFLSIILIGRTGLIVISIYYFLYIIYYFLANINQLFLSRKFLIGLSILLGLIIYIFVAIDFSKYLSQIEYAFELYLYFVRTGKINSLSIELLFREYFLPNNMIDIMIGTGKYLVASDVGWVRFIFGSGIIGIIIGFALYYYSFLFAYRYFNEMPRLAFFIIFYTFLIIPLNLKDYYFFGMGTTQLFFIILFTYIYFIEQKYQVT